ncbi:SusC/RagA family TonB-linked outer membrane protein [Rubrolithibacter danxiaensis]|uniref:SusC/RagA family TonB-linked outer membrane protein n=1 Tax=Rubrolithibacter danxiaensis TaxID=3390805 RepID=UPI003BF88D66
MLKFKNILLIIFFFVPGLTVFAQNRTITGKVLSATDNLPVPGAVVSVKETSKSISTNGDGSFTITAPAQQITLQVRSIGYTTREVKLSATQNTVNISLSEDKKELNEVVVVGYSDKKRSELTSAVSVVSAEDLKDVTTNNVGAMLQGKVAGLQVINNSGVPGATPEIRLRGVSSINASQSPLFVVDGIIGGNYDPNDVESITVLKDAGATAMYGSQANAGVIIVTTKKAQAGKTRFEAKITTGLRTPDWGKMQMMNSAELYNNQKEFYRDYVPGAADNSYKIDIVKFHNERPVALLNQNYDWTENLFKASPMENVYISASGKTEKNDYYAGLSYYNEKGTFLNTNFQRVNLRGNSTYHFSKNISLTNNINLSGATGKSYDYMDVYYSYLNMPWDNPYDENNNAVYVDGNSAFKWWSRDKVNPIHTVENSNHPYKGFDVNYDLALNINLTKWLSFSSSNRFAASFNKSSNFFSPLVAGTYHASGYLDEQNLFNYGAISNNLLKFNFQQGDHNISGLAGVAFEGSKTEVSGASGKGLPEGLDVLNVISNSQAVNGFYDKAQIQSFISQLNYNYKNKYFLTGSYRIDGSSAFPKGNQYASFPAVSAAWLISNEAFLESSSVIDNLKLRTSYGVTGTQDIGASRYLGLFSLAGQYNSQAAAIPLQLASPNLTWESKYQLNAGIDIGLFKRISLTVDAYQNTTKNLLLQVSQPLSVGFEQRWENVGQIVNKGVEIGLNTTNVQSKSFRWNTDFNINFNSNKLRDLPSPIIRTGSWSISQIYRNGGNLYEFYMPKWLGVDTQTGAPLWEIVTKNDQGVETRTQTSEYSKATLQEVGSALPKFQGGFNNEWSYKNFGLRVNAYFMYGNKVFSNNLRFTMNDGHEPYYNQIKLPDDAKVWTAPGDIATEPSPQNAANSTETSSRYLKDGSYLAIRNVALSYQLPQSFVKRLKMDGIVVSLTADNLYTFTDFLGQDPQTTITPGSFVTPGVSDFKYPNNRQYLLNINFRF